MSPARVTNWLPSSTLPIYLHPSHGGRPWIESSKSINQSVPLDPLKIEYLKQNANQLSGKSARLTISEAIEQADTTSTKRL